MKHLKSFESFEINEELLGMPKLSEVKAKLQDWLSKNKNNPELQEALQKVKEIMILERCTSDKSDQCLGVKMLLSTSCFISAVTESLA
jgi:hypothetical protein